MVLVALISALLNCCCLLCSQKFRQAETLPDPNLVYQPLPTDRKLRVFFSYQNFREFLTDDRFTLVDSPEESDIVWISQTFKDFEWVFSFKSCPMVLVKKAGTGLKHFPAFWTCFGSCFIFLSLFPWITLILSSIRLGVKPCFAVCSHSGLQTDQVLINFCGFLFFSHFCTGGLSKFNLRQCLYFILLLSL